MRYFETPVRGAWRIEPEPRTDDRGWFMRVWCSHDFSQHGIAFNPVQANMGRSILKGTVRGMHFQVAPALEAKLVRCTRGSLFDVVVDLRSDSPTFRNWYGTPLTADDGRMLFIPEGCAHACQALEDGTEFHYLTSAMYAPSHARGIPFDDPAIGVNWPLPVSAISDQDRTWPRLETN